MKNPFEKTSIQNSVDETIETVLKRIRENENNPMVNNDDIRTIEALTALRANTTGEAVNLNALIPAAISFLGVLTIVNHERTAVITSKAMDLVTKGFRK
jgi:hypothetical protein|nr:MAG TPA: hypothetical protein [Caudoviricetes sp.]